MISVIMSVYNEKEEEVRRAIESILDQSFQSFEFIIVNDNPQNVLLKKVVKEYEIKDKRIVILENKHNLGLAHSLNAGLKIAKYPYIARMDADDFSYPERFEIELSVLKKEADMVFSKFRFVNENNQPLKTSLKMPEKSEKVHQILKFRNIISHPTVMIKKKVLEEAGGYSDLKVVEDYDLWYRLSRMNVKMIGVNKILLDYTVRNDSMTTSNYYKTHMAGRYIRKVHNRNKMNKIKNSEFETWYSKNRFFEKHYNLSAKKYYTLIQRWSSIRAIKYFKLMLIVLQEPRLLKIVFQTIITNYLRKKR